MGAAGIVHREVWLGDKDVESVEKSKTELLYLLCLVQGST